jgi:hypothetical protein
MSQQFPPGSNQQWQQPPQQQYASAAAIAPPTPAPSAPKQPGVMHALSAPGGIVKALWIGVVLMMLSFAFKQILVDVSVQSISGMIEKERLRAAERAELSVIDAPLDPIDDEIAALVAKPPTPPTAEDDDDGKAFSKEKKAYDEQLDELKKKRAELDKDLQPKRLKVQKEFRPRISEAERNATQSTASGVGRLQLTLTLKIIFDILKLIGGAMVILSALRISVDPEQQGGAKAYAAVLGGIAFLSMVVGGLYGALFG